MTIDEAIRHCEEEAEKYMEYGIETECYQCGKEHEQLAEWLKELKERRNEGELRYSKLVKIVEEEYEVQGYHVREKYYCCPNCELTLGNLRSDNLYNLIHEYKYCKECGQKLNWDSIKNKAIKG